MTHEEAIKILMGYSHTPQERAALETLIPELCESEDERIRQTLIDMVKRETGFTGFPSQGQVLAYLEKQKDAFENGRQLGIMQEQARQELEWTDEKQKPVMILWTGKNLKEVIDFTGKSPKFGEWFKSWDEFEEYVHSHDDILKLFCEDGSHYEVPMGAWIVKTPDGYNIPSRFRFIQKPAEWSKEDEKMQYFVNQFLEYHEASDPTAKSCKKWFNNRLKSLRPQPKNEWSEEDERMRDRLITRLNWITYNTRTDGTSPNITFFKEIDWLKSLPLNLKKKNEDVAKLCSNEWSEEDTRMLKHIISDLREFRDCETDEKLVSDYEDEISFLKSLRPQPKRDCKDCAMFLNGECTKPRWKPSEVCYGVKGDPDPAGVWKPSEEQIKAIESCFCEFGEGCPDEDGLRSLYNDLKKLI